MKESWEDFNFHDPAQILFKTANIKKASINKKNAEQK